MKDYYTTEDVTDLIHQLHLAIWDWEKRADKQKVDCMNAKLGSLQVYYKPDNLKALCISASNKSSDAAMEIKLGGL